jgi:hypothetical protein
VKSYTGITVSIDGHVIPTEKILYVQSTIEHEGPPSVVLRPGTYTCEATLDLYEDMTDRLNELFVGKRIAKRWHDEGPARRYPWSRGFSASARNRFSRVT